MSLFEVYKSSLTSSIRESVWKRDHNTCQRCGLVSHYYPTYGQTSEGWDHFLMMHFKGGKTEPDYPGKKWLKLAQTLASKARKGERIIPITEQHSTNILRKYAKLAGVPNWDRLHNHRQRAYFGTFWARKTGRDYWKVQSLMGHKDLRATAVYVEELSLEEKKQLLDGS